MQLPNTNITTTPTAKKHLNFKLLFFIKTSDIIYHETGNQISNHYPSCKSSAAIQLVWLMAACAICAVNCVTTLCRISGGSTFIALPGWGASTQLVTNGS